MRSIANQQSTIDNLGSIALRRSVAPSLRRSRPAFTLVELLTVIFIIGLLIAILIPSLGAARNTAKKLSSQKALSSIDAGLELFRNDHEKDYSQTNGYPPSFVHPPLVDSTGAGFTAQDAVLGKFPYLQNFPQVYGAHFLPLFLMGRDAQGFIAKKDVPNTGNLRKEPWKWYDADPAGDGKTSIPRSPLYVDPNNLPVMATESLPGQPPEDLIPGWDEAEAPIKKLPVIVDAFDQPILYYAANKHGRETNMVEDVHDPENNYGSSAPQQGGPPYYFHQDNAGFTGTKNKAGWNFGASSEGHAIANPGDELSADKLMLDENRETFARYLMDRKVYSNLRQQESSPAGINQKAPLRPVNPDSYILVSPGVDGRYGTSDDVSNLPPWPDE